MPIKEAAEYMGLDITTIRRWTINKKINACKNPMNNRIMYKKEDLDAALKKINEGMQ